MARGRPLRVVLATPTERRIIDTLSKILVAAAASYEQCLTDLADPSRRSYRGAAHELREVLRETLDYLAPDAEVMAEPGFTLEKGTTRPTQRQKALHILRKRRLSREAMRAPELAVSMVDELGAAITRSAYTRGSMSAHGVGSGQEVRQLKMYVDAVLAELLEIHAPDTEPGKA
jgi:predicted pPIWI-associating nuclease